MRVEERGVGRDRQTTQVRSCSLPLCGLRSSLRRPGIGGRTRGAAAVAAGPTPSPLSGSSQVKSQVPPAMSLQMRLCLRHSMVIKDAEHFPYLLANVVGI